MKTWLTKTCHAFCAAMLVVYVAGCASTRVPAIDQTGQRIFAPATTELRSPFCGWFPKPAYTTPPAPPVITQPAPSPPLQLQPLLVQPQFAQPQFVQPPAFAAIPPCDCQPPATCIQPQVQPGIIQPDTAQPGVQQPPAATGAPRIVLTKQQVVTPVGSEVVLVAGVVNASGQLLAGQKVRWELEGGSVGQFASIDQNVVGSPTPEIAESTTGAGARRVDRGTADTSDDVIVQGGQTWISVQSVDEGTSRVRLIADFNGQQLQDTAVVYWVNVQWQTPAPAIVPAGGSKMLTSTLTRPDTNAPVAGWFVRYEVVSGATAGFGPGRVSGAEVQTDANGQATVELNQGEAVAGVTRIRIEFLRPAIAAGDPQKLPAGTAFTNVTWSAAGLSVKVSGPQQAAVAANAAYQIDVTNTGDQPALGVTVTDRMPPELSITGSNPPHQATGDENRWVLGELAPRETRSIVVQCRTQRAGDVRYCVIARSAPSLQSEACQATRIIAAAIDVQMRGPEEAMVGESAQYQIVISNPGATVLKNVQLTDTFDAGYAHESGRVGSVSQAIGDIPAGTAKQIALTFKVLQEGVRKHQLSITGDNFRQVDRAAELKALPAAAPAVSVKITGPAEVEQGKTAEYVIQVANTGNAALTNVRISDDFSRLFTPQSATPGVLPQRPPGRIEWIVNRLEVGATDERRVVCTTTAAAASSSHRATVTCDQGATASDEVVTAVTAPAGAAPVDTGGNLTISVADRSDPLKMTETGVYFIVITNDRKVADSDVQLTVLLPDGLEFRKVTGPERLLELRPGKREIVLQSTRSVRPGEAMQAFRLELKPVKPGKHIVRARVVSRLSPGGVEETEETTVLME